MNQMILVLNAVILATTFAVAFSTTDAQVGLLDSGSHSLNTRSARAVSTSRGESLAFLRVVQALGNSIPAEQRAKFTTDQYATLRRAVQRYYDSINHGVAAANNAEDSPDIAYERVGRQARDDVQNVLRNSFAPDSLVARLTTEVIRQSR